MRNAPDMVLVGEITGTHGIRGRVKIHTYTDKPETIGTYKTLVNQDGEPVTLTITSQQGNVVVAEINGLNKQEQAVNAGRHLFIYPPRFAESRRKRRVLCA